MLINSWTYLLLGLDALVDAEIAPDSVHVLFEVVRGEEHDHAVRDHRADIHQHLAQFFQLNVILAQPHHVFSKQTHHFFVLAALKSEVKVDVGRTLVEDQCHQVLVGNDVRAREGRQTLLWHFAAEQLLREVRDLHEGQWHCAEYER